MQNMRNHIIHAISVLLIFVSACGKSAGQASTQTSSAATEDVFYWTETPTIMQTPTLRPTRTPKPNLGSTRSDMKTFMEALGCSFNWDQNNEMAGTCSPQTGDTYPNLYSLSIGLNYLPDEYVDNAQVCSILRQAPTPQDKGLISFYMKSLAIAATPLWREGEQWVYGNIDLISQENPTIEKNVGRFTATLLWSKLDCTDVPDCQSLCFRLAVNQK
jgi:hypothetical protein